MLTLIFDIDGTLTDMWPLERAALSVMTQASSRQLDTLKAKGMSNLTIYQSLINIRMTKGIFVDVYRKTFMKLEQADALPELRAYQAVEFIKQQARSYRFVYATGGLQCEAEYVLAQFEIKDLFDLDQSTSQDTYRYSKKTGLPFRKIRRSLGPCCVITDSQSDIAGAEKVGVPAILLEPDDVLTG